MSERRAIDRSQVIVEVYPGAANDIEEMAEAAGGWVCEIHPDLPFEHDGCSGAGMSRGDAEVEG